jgi:hypothetical protein
MAVKGLIGLGLGIFGAGFMWKLYEDAINGFFLSYIRDSNDKYYLLSETVWNALPFLIIFTGIVFLVLGATIHNTSAGGES